MNMIFLTQSDTFIIGWVAKLLGVIMNGIFNVLDLIGLPNIGLSIILFTIVVNLLMMPLTIKQQKFSKLSAKMNPEIQAIQKKYKDKKDQDSMMAQNQEIQMVYAKYGVSPSGSCVQLLIQMPILFALYRVIAAMPAYVTKIRETYGVLADKIISVDNGAFLLNAKDSIQSTVSMYGKALTEGTNVRNGIIDILHKLSSTDLATVASNYSLNQLTYKEEMILGESGLLDTYNNFLGLNMADSPMTILKAAWAVGAIGIVIGAILIPVLSALTQWINVKLMPQQENKDNKNQADTMAQSMKTMNMMMPFMSAWFCLTLPAGMGLYWIAGSVVRSIQQIVVNRYMDKMDFDDIIRKNEAKSAKKRKKLEENQERLNAYANMKTKNIGEKANAVSSSSSASSTRPQGEIKPGSMRDKANMVKRFNESNNNK